MKLAASAEKILKREVWDFISGGAGQERTITANRAAFDQWSILPRVLVPTENQSLTTRILDNETSAPIAIAPMGLQELVHPKAERAMARVAASHNLLYIHSMSASVSMEEIARVCGDAPHWLQIYWPASPNLLDSFYQRALDGGFSALVITVDNPAVGWRPRDLDNSFAPFRDQLGMANYTSDPVFSALADEQHCGDAAIAWSAQYSKDNLTWETLRDFCTASHLPVIIKGTLNYSDIELALASGACGIVISNHGGRQIDRCVAALDALDNVALKIDPTIPLFFDSGIRTGSDVFIAMALGAKLILLGRPLMWGLAVDGERGVDRVLTNIIDEFARTRRLSGVPNGCDITRDSIRKWRL